MNYLPWRAYHDEEHVAELQQAIEREIEMLWQARDDLFLQLRVSTSTWGMAEHEKDCAITVDTGKPQIQRLAGWRAKRRGRSTTTEELLRSVAQSYTDGPVLISVYPSLYLLELKLQTRTWTT